MVNPLHSKAEIEILQLLQEKTQSLTTEQLAVLLEMHLPYNLHLVLLLEKAKRVILS